MEIHQSAPFVPEPAPLGRRFAAFAIDGILFMILLWAVSHLIYAFGVEFPVNAWLSVFPPLVAFICWIIGNTPGKKYLGLRIVSVGDGDRPTTIQWFLRCLLFALVVFLNVLFIVPVLISKKRQALHDMMAGTMVIED